MLKSTTAHSFYRVQGLTFDEIRQILPYLKSMGFDGIYLPPILDAASHSDASNRHGYDNISFFRISPKLGGRRAFRELMRATRKYDLAVALDWVPNHTSDQNRLYKWGSRVYDWYDHDGERRCGNFFGLGWLPRLKMQSAFNFLLSQSYFLWLAATNRNVAVVRRDHSDGLAYPHQVAGWATRFLRLLGSKAIIIDEKILQLGEDMPEGCNTSGAVGYTGLIAGSLLCHNQPGARMIEAAWRAKTGSCLTDAQAAQQCKFEAALLHFPADLDRAVHNINTLARRYHKNEIGVAELARMLATFSVYRIYPLKGHPLSRADQRILSRSSLPQWFKEGLMTGRTDFVKAAEPLAQLMSAVYAKGVEDRMFYRSTWLSSLREVGGALGLAGLSAREYHLLMESWLKAHPLSWATTDTHDTKRSLLSRSRLAACTWVPDQYLEVMERLTALSEKHNAGSVLGPQAVDFVLQTLLSVWPYPEDRLLPYFQKAFREKGVETSWFQENRAWEQEVERFVRAILSDREFLGVLQPFTQAISRIGFDLALNQQLLKFFAAGVADVYQGSEGINPVWLVDPDNRRKPDFYQMQALFRTYVEGELSGDGYRGPPTGSAVYAGTMMMRLIYTCLQARKLYPQAVDAPYEAITVGEGKICIRRGPLVAVMAIDPFVSDVKNDGPQGEILLSYGRQEIRLVA
jgi:(1->4)-alpha-D-glucan 1-alpha-D-glucosylmutase